MSVESSKRLSPGDPNSFSRPDEAKVVDIFLQLEIDFNKKVLHGAVTLTVERKKESVTHLILDSRDLDIQKVTNEEGGENLEFNVGPEGYVGSKLEIRLPIQGIRLKNQN